MTSYLIVLELLVLDSWTAPPRPPAGHRLGEGKILLRGRLTFPPPETIFPACLIPRRILNPERVLEMKAIVEVLFAGVWMTKAYGTLVQRVFRPRGLLSPC